MTGIVDAEILAVHVFDMVERENIVRTGEDTALFQFDFRYPVLRQVVIYVQITQFQVLPIYQPLCAVLEVIGIVQRRQAGYIGYIPCLFCPAYLVVQIPLGNISVVA